MPFFISTLPLSHFFVAEANIRGRAPLSKKQAVYLSTVHVALGLFKIKIRTLRFCKKGFSASFPPPEFMGRFPLLTCSQLCQNCFYYTLLNLQKIKVSAQKCIASIKYILLHIGRSSKNFNPFLTW